MTLWAYLRQHVRWIVFTGEYRAHLQRQRIGEWTCPYCGEYEDDCDDHPSWRGNGDAMWTDQMIVAALAAAGGAKIDD